MQSGWRVGSIFGIPFLIDPSWFIIILLVTLVYRYRWQADFASMALGMAFVMALLLFASVLLHELGHSLVARLQGIRVRSITLFFFGGVASIEQEPKTPGKAFQVAIAGPLVSFSLFAGLALATPVLRATNPPAAAIVSELSEVNLWLTLFNLIPGLPLDGGQVLKSIVWKVTGSQIKGIRWASKAGQLIGTLGIGWGIGAILRVFPASPVISPLWAALIGWFVLRNAAVYDRLTDVQEALLKIRAEDAMTREFRVVDAEMSLRHFADEHLISENRAPVYYASSNGRYRGMVDADALQSIERSFWESKNLFSILQPLTEVPTVQASTPIVEVIPLLEEQKLPRITVLSPAEAVSGVIDRGDIVRALAEKMNLRISDSAIKQIKEEGTYPPGLQLVAIAQAAADLR
jgi:Zn-dependent protease